MTLKDYIRFGFPKAIDSRLVDFKHVKNDLTIVDGLIYKGSALIIPDELRHIVLQEIHRDHFGIDKCKSHARNVFYWPGMSKMIEKMIVDCPECSSLKPKSSSARQWNSWPEAKKQFERVHIDFGEVNGQTFLVFVDAFSRWPEIYITKDMKEETLRNSLRNIFSRFGIPETLVSDNGPSLIAKDLET